MNSRALPLIVLLTLPGARAVSAQAMAPRANSALFGGAAVNPSKHDALFVTFSAAAGYDDNRLAADPSVARVNQAGALTTLDPRLVYAWDGKHLKFDASVGSDLRLYSASRSVAGSTHYGGFDVSGGSARTRVSFSQSVHYSPADSGLFSSSTAGVTAAAANGAYGVSGQQALFANSDLQVAQALSRRARISAIASYWTQDLSSVPDSTTRGYTAGARLLLDLSRDATLHAGYVHREADSSFSRSPKTVLHDVDLGIDYHRALSLSRRTHASVGLASSIVNTPVAADAPARNLMYRLGGTATLSHDMRRTWRLRAEYRRAVDILEVVAGPVFSDGITTSLGGFFTRSTDLDVSAMYSRGTVGAPSGASSRLQTYTATARLRRALGRRWALFGEYHYYNYSFGSNVAVAGGIPRSLDRNSVQTGITLWLPLMRK